MQMSIDRAAPADWTGEPSTPEQPGGNELTPEPESRTVFKLPVLLNRQLRLPRHWTLASATFFPLGYSYWAVKITQSALFNVYLETEGDCSLNVSHYFFAFTLMRLYMWGSGCCWKECIPWLHIAGSFYSYPVSPNWRIPRGSLSKVCCLVVRWMEISPVAAFWSSR